MNASIGRWHLCTAAIAVVVLSGCNKSPDENAGAVPLDQEKAVVLEMPPLDESGSKPDFKNFEEFKKAVYKEPFEGGVYIVNGDTSIPTEEELRKFYSEVVALKFMSGKNTAIVIDAPGGKVAGWTGQAEKNLTYCVSRTFGPRYDTVVQNMKAAADAWQKAADVKFVHLNTFDDKCDAANSSVVFDVRPVNVNGQYLARAFFPRYSRPQRNVLIDSTSFGLDPAGKLQLVGILRHELGHVLGFRHEQTRPEAGKCFEDKDWKPLSSYDAYSVMHYPQCNGLGDWSLTLTVSDQTGAACFYGKAEGFAFDEKQCLPLSVRFLEPKAIPYKKGIETTPMN